MKSPLEFKRIESEQPSPSHGGYACSITWKLYFNGIQIGYESNRYKWDDRKIRSLKPPSTLQDLHDTLKLVIFITQKQCADIAKSWGDTARNLKQEVEASIAKDIENSILALCVEPSAKADITNFSNLRILTCVEDFYNQHARATPSADALAGLVRYDINRWVEDLIEQSDSGSYVLYSEVAALVADLINELSSFRSSFKEQSSWKERADAAEVKVKELEAAWLDAEGKISDLEDELKQLTLRTTKTHPSLRRRG